MYKLMFVQVLKKGTRNENWVERVRKIKKKKRKINEKFLLAWAWDMKMSEKEIKILLWKKKDTSLWGWELYEWPGCMKMVAEYLFFRHWEEEDIKDRVLKDFQKKFEKRGEGKGK